MAHQIWCPTRALDGLWDFTFLDKVDVDVVSTDTLQFTEFMPVSAAFNVMPAYSGKL